MTDLLTSRARALLCLLSASFSSSNRVQARGVAGSTTTESWMGHSLLLPPLALRAGVSSRCWEGSISTETGTKQTAPRITKPSGRAAAGCCLLCRWVHAPAPCVPGGSTGRGWGWRYPWGEICRKKELLVKSCCAMDSLGRQRKALAQ